MYHQKIIWIMTWISVNQLPENDDNDDEIIGVTCREVDDINELTRLISDLSLNTDLLVE